MITEEFRNKMIKHFWVDCIDRDTGNILLDRIDGDDSFGGILINENGCVEFDSDDFFDIINRVVDATEQYLRNN